LVRKAAYHQLDKVERQAAPFSIDKHRYSSPSRRANGVEIRGFENLLDEEDMKGMKEVWRTMTSSLLRMICLGLIIVDRVRIAGNCGTISKNICIVKNEKCGRKKGGIIPS
jgi:hypothetical protein